MIARTRVPGREPENVTQLATPTAVLWHTRCRWSSESSAGLYTARGDHVNSPRIQYGLSCLGVIASGVITSGVI